MTKNNNKKELLLKKIKDLTKDDINELLVPLGTKDLPFPMYGNITVESDGKKIKERRLTAIASDKLDGVMHVYSERPAKEVIAMSYCNMPVPSMLPFYKYALEQRKPDHKRRIQVLIGDPGAGKSFMAAELGRVQSGRPSDVLDCGGKNMRELLFEMVLDFGSGDKLSDAIDQRLLTNTMSDMGMGLIKKLKNINTDKEGKEVSFVTELEDGKLEIDWNGLTASGDENVDKAFKILKEVSFVENLESAGGNALGMNSQYGPLIKSFISGDPIVLDEYNKSKEGTDDNLQTVLQFANGEISECVVENPLKNKDSSAGPSHFVFKQEDMKASWFVTVTGNAAVDGVTTRELNKSVYSRIEPLIIPEPTLMDWQHRICQIMTGMPVSTIYETFKESADADPVAFGEFLLSMRKTMAEVQGTEVPKIQETFLRNWQNVNVATEKLAKVYDGWKKTIDPDFGPTMHPQLNAENIDESYSAQVSIDFRKIIQHIEEAFRMTPTQTKVGLKHKFNIASLEGGQKLKPSSDEELSVGFGTRLTNVITDKMYETSSARGKTELYKVLVALGEDCGLTDIQLQEGAKSNQKSVEDALNLSAFDEKDPSKQAILAQSLLCDFIREKNPEVTNDNDKIISIVKVREALTKLKEVNEDVDSTIMLVPNTDPKTLTHEPLIEVEVVESAAKDDDYIDSLACSDLATYDSLMASFALPNSSNQKAIWHSDLDGIAASNDSEEPSSDEVNAEENQEPIEDLENTEATKMMENRSESGLAVTTVTVQDIFEGQECITDVHIIRSGNRDKTIIIGNPISERLSQVFNEAGVIHINKFDKDAASNINDAVSDILRGFSDEDRKHNESRLKLAFNFRNDVPDDADEASNDIPDNINDLTMAEVILYPGIENHAPKYLIPKKK